MQLFQDLIIIFLTVKIFGHFFKKLGQPALLGKLLAGIILGPSLLGILEQNEFIKYLGQLGVFILMFLAGLETKLDDFRNNIIASLLTALGGIIFPFFMATDYALSQGFSLNTSIYIGVVLIATSVSISVQTLREIGKIRTFAGYTILGAAVIDDILGLVILSMVIGYNTGNFEIYIFGNILIKVIIFLTLAIISGYLIVPLFLKLASRILVTEGPLTFSLIIVLTFSLLAEYMGLAGIIGAYFAGIMIGRTKYREKIFNKIEVLGNSFLFPVFFVSIGIITDLNSLKGRILIFTIIILFIAVISKILGAGLGAYVSGYNIKSSLGIGSGMVSRGEVALIIANIGLESGFLNLDLYSSLVVVTILTTLITPILLKLTFKEIY